MLRKKFMRVKKELVMDLLMLVILAAAVLLLAVLI